MMARPDPQPLELTYPLGTAARLTGLSPELLRAWERRYQVVTPQRTPGGTRRYTAEDLERLRWVKAAVDAGHRIGQVAQLDLEALKRCSASPSAEPTTRLDEVLAALDRLDAEETRRQLAVQFAALGPLRFAREFALPLVREIGERWAAGKLSIASEHLATSILNAMLGSAIQPGAAAQRGAKIVFATPPGERHELGLQMAALTAMSAGANPIYLGVDLPLEQLLGAARAARADVLALGIVAQTTRQAAQTIRAVRDGLPAAQRLWIGGRGTRELEPVEGVEYMPTLELLEQRVALLGHALGRA